MFKKKLTLNFLRIISELIETLQKNRLIKAIKKYLPLLLVPLFFIYIVITLNRSEVSLFNYQTLKFTLLFLLLSLLISPIFIISKSLIFHFLKLALGLNSTYKRSLNSLLFASSIDVFTPAKVNDFARSF